MNRPKKITLIKVGEILCKKIKIIIDALISYYETAEKIKH